jgi:hypothetical protein
VSRLAAVPILSAVLVLSGCAIGRNVLPVEIDAGRNPPQGTAVRIDAVEDARVFVANPPDRETPSVGGSELGNKSITSRVVALKRNSLCMTMGDVLLAEGASVAALVQAAVTRGLRESGYRVLGAGEAGYEQAVPIKLRVEQFWSWSAAGVFAITLSNRAVVAAQGGISPLAQGRTFSSQAESSTQITTQNDWLTIVTKGLDALTVAVKDGLR